METDSSARYRQRIYASYVNARKEPLAPRTLAGLETRMPYLRHMIRRYLPSDRRAAILELGCGHGALLYALLQAGYTQARGVDGSAEQVEAAKQLGVIGITQGDVMTALSDTGTASVDVIITFDFIEHLTKSELIPFVDEVHRVLRPGGRWILHVPNGESPLAGKIRYSDFTHELAFTRTSLTQLLKASGFSDVDCFEDRPVPHGLRSLIRAILWRIIRIFLVFYIAVETGGIDRRAVFSQNMLAVALR
ncbi:class I SAM-dependent methyltransferase [Imhoffiella purpurea]|uniref:class I SAM-dependent methyltransferase n=1 Tax=Imhoffiella purpurea TaxID=1249627 RepID=UPI0006950DCE|nr:class I SAM-dependent methyltransferase [Imhoffiella purpurea]